MKIIALIFTITLVLRLLFLSHWLEDWDSVQFAIALDDFSLVKHQPHAPGYPIYILLGKVFNLFLQNKTLALTLVSAIFGSLGIVLVYIFAKRLFDGKTALMSSLILIFTPIHWLLSIVALTNIPGLFSLTLVAYLSYVSITKSKLLPVTGFISGFVLGLRFTEISVIIALLAIPIFLQRKTKVILSTFLLFFLGICLWVIPMTLINGVNDTIESYIWIANYILNHDTQLGKTSYNADTIFSRLNDLSYILRVAYTPLLLVSFLLSVILITKEKLWTKKEYLFLGTWFMAYFIPLTFIFNLEVSRYTLPIAPPIAILTARLITQKTKGLLSISLASILILILSIVSFSQVKQFHKTIPPSIEPVLHVKKNFSPVETTIISTFTYRQFQYYASEFKNYYGVENTPEEITSPIVILDYIGTKDRLKSLKNYQIVETKEFSGPQDLFQRLPITKLYILKKLASEDS